MTNPIKNIFSKWVLRITCTLSLAGNAFLQAQDTVALPDEGGQTPAITYDYFPSRLHAFVWRNWTLVPAERLAQVLQTSTKRVEQLAVSMGLSSKQRLEPEWNTSRGYITIVRRNWHLLPYDQLLTLLNMSREELKFRLVEDDFLWVKLGNMKPKCAPLYYKEPDDATRKRAAQFAADVKPIVRQAQFPEEARFGFMRPFDQVTQTPATTQHVPQTDGFQLRIIFPYFTDYGDPLLDETLSSYPEELFRQLSEVGVNGIWLHSVLRMMMRPDAPFPGDAQADKRVEGLRRLVNRAAKYGVKVYLYLNEPRAMDVAYFHKHADRLAMAGPEVDGLRSLCTSQAEVRNWLSRSLEKLFREVNGLGGVFTITASENFTYCGSRPQAHQHCPLCSKRSFAELATELNRAIEEGVHRGDPDAKVIVWDWGWPDNQAEQIINGLPQSCWFMSVSEWSLPLKRGGIDSQVGEYSISAVGPGPRAARHWDFARKAGLRTMAKVQVNASWEMAVVPSVPVLNLVAEHAANLSKEHIQGVMLSWSLGGFPSENLKLFQTFRSEDQPQEAIHRLAVEEYGREVAPLVEEAWRRCSESYKHYPYHIRMVYNGPQHMGPSNPIFLRPTHYASTMVGLPYDHLEAWRSVYPTPIWLQLMDQSAEGFEQGARILEQARAAAPRKRRKALDTEIRRMRTVYLHLKSGAEQGRFIDARDKRAKSKDPLERQAHRQTMLQALAAERRLILQMLPIASKDSSIGYESSNQYFYVPLDLAEALASVAHAERQLLQAEN